MIGQHFSKPPAYSNPEANELEPLNDYEQAVLAAVTQHYFIKKEVLTPETAAKRFETSVEELIPIWKKEAFQHALRVKGIITDAVFKEYLTPQQILAVDMVTMRYDSRSLREKLKEANVKPNQWQGWLNSPVFVRYLQLRSGIDFKAADVIAERTIVNAMESGDLTAAKLYMEMTGRHSNKLSVDVNVHVLLEQVVDVLMPFLQADKVIEAADAIDRLLAAHTGSRLPITAIG